MFRLTWDTEEEMRDSSMFVVSVGLTVLSAILLIIGLSTASLELDDYGLAGSFPTVFYTGLVLLLAPIAGQHWSVCVPRERPNGLQLWSDRPLQPFGRVRDAYDDEAAVSIVAGA